MNIEISFHEWTYKNVFRISYSEERVARTLRVEISQGGLTGRGEAMGLGYNGETPESMAAQINLGLANVDEIAGHDQLYELLPAGGARCALDCALWDLEAKRLDRRVWEIARVGSLRDVVTDYTITLDTPPAMAAMAQRYSGFRTLKLKLGGDEDVERVRAVRKSCPNTRLIVDANQGWAPDQLRSYIPELHLLGVALIEQPLPVGADEMLFDFESPIPICADESCQTTSSLADLVGKYSFVNIKLEKAGGLTEGLRLVRQAKQAGFGIMTGCMGGSSLAMAPALLVAQQSEFVDLDGPLLLDADVEHGLRYDKDVIKPFDQALWG